MLASRTTAYVCLEHCRLFLLRSDLLTKDGHVSTVVVVMSIQRLKLRLQCFYLAVTLSQNAVHLLHLQYSIANGMHAVKMQLYFVELVTFLARNSN